VARAAPVVGLEDGAEELGALVCAALLLLVTPKPVLLVADGRGFVEIATLVPLPDREAEPLVDLAVGVALSLTVTDWVEDTAPMANVWLVAKMVLMSEMSTNVM